MNALVFLSLFLISYFFMMWTLDPFGLLRNATGRKIRIIYNERLSKLLFARFYIPKNFDSAILGTSLSDNLDIHGSSNYRFYNASVMGANMSLLFPLAECLIKGGIKNMVICVTPYMMKSNVAAKPIKLKSNFFHSFLDLKNLLSIAVVWVIRTLGLTPKFPRGQFNECGVHHYYHLFEKKDIDLKITEVIKDNENRPLTVEPAAIALFSKLVQMLNGASINYLVYFHPLPTRIFESKRPEYLDFQESIRQLVPAQRLIDFNHPSYTFFTSDLTHFIDHGHLSQKGQAVLGDIFISRLAVMTISDHVIFPNEDVRVA